MKKSFILTLMIIICSSIFADHNTGDFLIGCKIYYSKHNTDKEFTDNGFERYYNRETGKMFFNPNFGYFVSKSSALGLGLKYECVFSEYRNYSSDPAESFKNIFSLVPFFTKYFTINSKFSITTTLQFEVGIGKDEFESEDKTESEILKLGCSISPAVSYSLSPSWIINLSVGNVDYSWTREMLSDNDEYKNIDQHLDINLNLNKVSLGFQYIIHNN